MNANEVVANRALELRATRVAREVLQTGKDVAALVLEQGLMSPEDLEAALRPEALTRPRALPKLESDIIKALETRR